MNAQWHPSGDLITRYAAGRLDSVQVMSVESHIARCPRCRTAVPYDEGWLESSWDGIADVVDAPRTRPLARMLRGAGVPEHVATFLAATPALVRSWVVAVVAVLSFAVAAAHLAAPDPSRPLDALVPFLAVAPVLPLAGIALAYGPRVDPVHEVQAATPMAGARTLLLRALAVLVVAIALTGVATPLLPGPPGLAAAWLTPSLALSAGTLALSTRFSPLASAAALAAAWLAAVTAGGVLGPDALPLFSPAAQAAYGMAALASTLLVHLRRARLDRGEFRWKSMA
ncbi:hypothetical protein Pth03_32070 [Planotetraspora thailandica]|uniref:Putative zinc-finger domain-containing protein n=1 Tax=Planotetraspora thailandica TaxID=487172 RepID=A0A8J3V0Z3_9ACTN|nr:zf-HC2 domain-containing protein [Planotetraspora thailandica]GII54818.1 hypothetical protein Pth03_32070 [Planotetraspora thailandica]